MKAQTIAQFLAVAATASAAQYGNTVHRSSPQRISSRGDSTGPTGYVTVDDTDDYQSLAGNKFSTAGGNSEVHTSEHVKGAFTSCIPVFEGATVEDCKKVIADIRANKDKVTVTGGHCMNWQEGTCLARVCGRASDATFSQDPQWIADALEEHALDVCVARGESGVVADCQDNADPCGTYRLWLQAQPHAH